MKNISLESSFTTDLADRNLLPTHICTLPNLCVVIVTNKYKATVKRNILSSNVVLW